MWSYSLTWEVEVRFSENYSDKTKTCFTSTNHYSLRGREYFVQEYFFFGREVRKGNVFIRVCPSISQSVHKEGGPCDHYPWCIWPHFTAPLYPDIRHRAPSYPDPDSSLLVKPASHHWRPVEICSLEDNPPPRDCWRSYGQHMRAVRILLECVLAISDGPMNCSLVVSSSFRSVD